MRKNEGNGTGIVSGVAIGCGLMYLLDPDRGHRRRMLMRDKAVRAVHVTSDFADKSVRDLENRARGVVAEAWARLRDRAVPDDVLVERVRARMGRAVSHPHAITVQAKDGIVTLSGPVLEHEVEHLLKEVRSVRGVKGIENRLEPHKQAENIPALQGGSHRQGSRFELLQEYWAPSTRTVVGLAGAGLLSVAPRNRLLRVPLGMAGSALILRALTNMPLHRALGLDDTRRVITLQKTVNIHAPIEEIYKLFANPENFSRIFEHVERVRHLRDDLYHWTVLGPGGLAISWDAVVTQNVPNRLIAWSSVPGSIVGNAGIVKFQQTPEGVTSVHIRMNYNPPAGAIGHLIASLFGADPKHALDDDMARLKSLFEIGKTTAHHERVTREEIEQRLGA